MQITDEELAAVFCLLAFCFSCFTPELCFLFFTVTGNDGGARIIRKVGEQYEAKHIVPTKKYGDGGVMIWNCFHANGFGPLILVDGTVDQDKYINILA